MSKKPNVVLITKIIEDELEFFSSGNSRHGCIELEIESAKKLLKLMNIAIKHFADLDINHCPCVKEWRDALND